MFRNIKKAWVYSAQKKLEIICSAEASGLPREMAVTHFDVQIRTYYRWLKKFRGKSVTGLHDKTPYRGRSRGQLLDDEPEKVMDMVLLYPDWSSRKVACYVTDNSSFSVSESTVYRLLKKAGLIKEVETNTFPAGPEYTVNTKRTNQQRQTDATYMLLKN